MRKNSQCLTHIFLTILTLCVLCLCIAVGSVAIPFSTVADVLLRGCTGQEQNAGTIASIILNVRLPRVLCIALEGASLSLCGAAMQGLLRNPLAEGSTLGVSSGAALGAAAAILFGIQVPILPAGGTMISAMVAAFLSLLLILTLAWSLDHTMATNSIILIGVIFSMFVSAVMSVLVTFSGDKLRSITFWTMGSASSASMTNALVLCIALTLCGAVLLSQSRALDAFAMGEAQAQHIGVPVKAVKLTVLIAVSVLIGVCVSICGCIGFVGLVTPHMVRMLSGPKHSQLMIRSMFFGASFLMLCDLAARTLIAPLELPVGVVTSLIGAVVFVCIFYHTRKAGQGAC